VQQDRTLASGRDSENARLEARLGVIRMKNGLLTVVFVVAVAAWATPHRLLHLPAGSCAQFDAA
jgi:hypothetical protein